MGGSAIPGPTPARGKVCTTRLAANIGYVCCVEGDVVANALELFDDPKVKIIDYGITNDTAWEVGLACGGDIRIRIEILK